MVTQERLRELLSYDSETGVFHWRVSRGRAVAGASAGNADSYGYLQTKIYGRCYLNHRLAWLYVYGEWPDGQIDHINGSRADNRLANLRNVSISVNQQNQRGARVDNRCGLLGVSRKGNRWQARISHPGRKDAYLGLFDTPELAHAAYLKAKRKLHQGCTI
jgi:hypothetical protein